MFTFLLDCIVCQVDLRVAEVADVIFVAAGPYIPFFVKIPAEVGSLDNLGQAVHPNIEFP